MTEASIRTFQVFRALHFLGWGMWLGGLFSTSYFLLFRNGEQDGGFRTRLGKMAKGTALVADIGSSLAILGGIYQAQWEHVWKMHWLHAKLAFVVVLLGYHGWLRIQAKRASQGGPKPFPAVALRILGPLVMIIIALAVFKPFH